MGKNKNSTRQKTENQFNAELPTTRSTLASNESRASEDEEAASALADNGNTMMTDTAAASDEDTPHAIRPQQPDAILAAINSLKAESLERHREVLDGIAHIRTDLDTIRGRLTTAETRISDTEDTAAQLTAKMTKLETQVKFLTEKNEDLENRSRRSNLRLIGLPESAEGRDAEAFLEKWLPDILGAENFPTAVRIERAHRIPSFPTGPAKSTRSAPFPRPLIMKFLNFKDKVCVMKAAQAKGKVMYENRQVKFFSDFSAEVQRQRKAYDAVKQRLRSEGIQYGLQFPAKLRITHGGKNYTFLSPQDVHVFIRKNISSSHPEEVE